MLSASSISSQRVSVHPLQFSLQHLCWRHIHRPLGGVHNLGELRQIFETKYWQCWCERRRCLWGMKGRQTWDFHRMRHLQLLHDYVQYSLTCRKPLLQWFWLNGLDRENVLSVLVRNLWHKWWLLGSLTCHYCQERCQLLLVCPSTRTCYWNKKQFTKSLNYFHL